MYFNGDHDVRIMIICMQQGFIYYIQPITSITCANAYKVIIKSEVIYFLIFSFFHFLIYTFISFIFNSLTWNSYQFNSIQFIELIILQ